MESLNDGFTVVLSGRTILFVTVSAGRCPGLRKPLGFQPVVLWLCGHYIHPQGVPWAKETIGLSARLCLYGGVVLRNFVQKYSLVRKLRVFSADP